MRFLIDGEDRLPETDAEVSHFFEDEALFAFYMTCREQGKSVIEALQHVLEVVAGIQLDSGR